MIEKKAQESAAKGARALIKTLDGAVDTGMRAEEAAAERGLT